MSFRQNLVTVIAALSAMACAPPTTTGGGRGPGEPAVPPSRTLVAAVKAEPASIAARPLQEASGVGLYLTARLFNAQLGLLDDRGVPLPYLAESLPELNSDAWRVFPDGRMETTYRLKPGLVWHDGVALSSADFVLAGKVYSSPELGLVGRLPMNVIESVSAPDDRTVVIQWKRPYPDAGSLTDRNGEMPALPRHVLQPLLDEGQSDTLANHPYWNREHIGLGPYQLDRWEPGAFLEAAAFDRHALGRPKISRIRILFIADSNAVLANMLSGEIHLAAVDALRLEQALQLKRQWEAARAGDVLPHPNQWRAIHFQHRPDLANPKAVLDPRVRKALAHTIDRQSINEAVYGGTLEIADSMVTSKSEWADAVARTVVRYDYDPRRSEQLMAEAGSVRAADGVYTSLQDGRFAAELKTNAAVDNEQEMTILASRWREAGFQVQDAVLPAAQAQNNEVRSTFPAMFANNGPLGEAAMLNQASSRIPSAENRWNGSNRGGWVNAEYNRLLDAFSTTLDRSERAQQAAQMVRIYTEEVAGISLLFRAHPWTFVSALKGFDRVAAPEAFMAWNVHEWRLE